MGNKSVSKHHMLVPQLSSLTTQITSPCIQPPCVNNTASIQSLSAHQQSGEHTAFSAVLCSLVHISFSVSLSLQQKQERSYAALENVFFFVEVEPPVCLWRPFFRKGNRLHKLFIWHAFLNERLRVIVVPYRATHKTKEPLKGSSFPAEMFLKFRETVFTSGLTCFQWHGS